MSLLIKIACWILVVGGLILTVEAINAFQCEIQQSAISHFVTRRATRRSFFNLLIGCIFGVVALIVAIDLSTKKKENLMTTPTKAAYWVLVVAGLILTVEGIDTFVCVNKPNSLKAIKYIILPHDASLWYSSFYINCIFGIATLIVAIALSNKKI